MVTTSSKLETGQVLLRGDNRNGLYRLPTPSTKSSSIMALSGVRTTLHGWHQRLGHPHESALRNLVSSFNLPVSSNKLPGVCGPCQLGKSHRFNLPTCHVPSRNPFELVYSDVWGPSPIFSINGNRYFLLFIDDHTRFVWIYFLSHKSQVFSYFEQFRAMIHTQFSATIKNLQTDWGGEYRNVSAHLKILGIHHRVSCPHTQEQNGAVERRNRVIVEKGLALLAQSSMPHLFWEHTFKTATYLHNRTPTPALANRSPYQLLCKSAPDYTFLKTFGCLCYPFLRPYTQHKMDFRSKACVLIGYSASHKGYLCYHRPTSRIYVARHVVFDESVFPYATAQPMPPPPTYLVPPSPDPTFFLKHAINATLPCTPPHSPTFHSLTQSPSHNTHVSQVPSSSTISPPSHDTPHISTPHHLSQTSAHSPTYLRPTISSEAKCTQPPKTHYRPSTSSVHPMTTRAATKSLKPKTFSTTLVTPLEKEPSTFNQAIKHTCWQIAMQDEYNALMRNNTWSLVACPTNVNLVGCKWIFRIKRNSDGTVQRHKARLVAQGFSQEAGVDYFETFSPVIRPTTIRLVLSIALSKGWIIRQLDINNAFLNGDLTDEVYMQQPRGFEDSTHPTYVCRLNKALYGLKQAPRAWFTKLKTYLLTQGYRACHSDTSLFTHMTSTSTTYILVYVDDLIITGSDSHYIQHFITNLNAMFSLKDLGGLSFFLGLQIHRTDKGLQLSQQQYLHDVLAKCNMLDSSSVTTPADPQTRLVKYGEPCLDPQLYRQIVGSLQYATITRPDITYAVNRVCQFMHSPTTSHWQAVKRILRYLNGTLSHSLQFKPTTADSLVAFSDAGWVSDKEDSRSQYGYAIFHGPNLISWTSRKQKVVARSSTEAEYRALAYTAAELLWLKQLLTDLHMPLKHPPLLLCDNVGAIFLSKNPVISTRSKHIALDFHFVRELVEAAQLRIAHVSSHDQLADIFTKALPKDRINYLRHKLQVQPDLALAGG
ncbi:Retrovirus-related Pol polyprotein from transposon TNT 1-94 [Linum perenne]